MATRGARKVAELIMQDDEYIFTTFGRKTVDGLAELIDDQTGATALLDACRKANSWVGMYQNLPGHEAAVVAMLSVLHGALKKAECDHVA